MGRISESEINRLKTQISLVRLVEAAGIELKKHGAKDMVGHCPFHDDKTPSLVITPKKNLWHCLGACNTGGSVVDWVMRREKVSFRHAVELLRADVPGSDVEQRKAEPAQSAQSNNLALPLAVDPKADEADLLNQVVGFYHATLKQAPEAREYLKQRGLDNAELIDTFKLGFANRTLGYRLPDKTTVAGKAVRARMQKAGILRSSGHEHLRGSLIIPITDTDNNIQQLYGRKLLNNLRAGTAYHLYLPGPQRGVFNVAGLINSEEVILCEALIDALTFWAAGYRNVTASYGVNGFTKEHLAFFKQVGIKRVLIAYDRDEAGDKAADKLATELQKEGFACFRILFPKGMDANQYAMSVKPARQSLGLVISKAHWLGNGKPPVLDVPCAAQQKEAEPESKPEPVPEPEPILPLAAKATKEKNTGEVENPPTDNLPEPSATASPVATPPTADLPVTVSQREVILLCGPRRYRVRGLTASMNDAVMKINLLVNLADPSPQSPDPSPGTAGALHVDTLDLYSAKQRSSYASSAASELGVTPAVIQHDLGRVLLALEGVQDSRTEPKPEPVETELTAEDEAAALELLRDPNLVDRISDDITATGLVGEPVNGLVCYLAAISRKLPQPLAIIIQSTSAAGKSALMEAVLDLVPDEDRVQYSAMTGQSLFYLGETDLKHRILGIAEEEGVRQASYALKLLQSQGELTIASTSKDPESGKLVTEAYRVEGPVMLLLTTTAIDIDEELLNRCLVLTVNESREQTRLIHHGQRTRRTLAGLMASTKADAIKDLHRAAQRLLQPLAVVNPFAEQLTFMDERPRTRRDHQKYLTLIDAIALLHQYQREIKYLPATGADNKPQAYVEVTLDDIVLANRLAHTVLGRSLDELPPVTRSLLGHVVDYVKAHSEQNDIPRHEIRFTRRQLRQVIGWGDTQLKTHVGRLCELEYLMVHRQGQTYAYELAYNGDGKDEPFLMGLLDVKTLGTMPNRSGQNTGWSGQTLQRSGGGRPLVGGWSGGGRGKKNGGESCAVRLSSEKDDVEAKTHVVGDKKTPSSIVQSSSYAHASSFFLAANLAADLAAGSTGE